VLEALRADPTTRDLPVLMLNLPVPGGAGYTVLGSPTVIADLTVAGAAHRSPSGSGRTVVTQRDARSLEQ
jgi:hypothetical protein